MVYTAVYVATSDNCKIPSAEPSELSISVGPLSKFKDTPLPSTIVSVKVILLISKFPTFSSLIVKVILSPGEIIPSPLSNVIVPVFVNSISGSGTKSIIVGSFSVFPSVSSSSSAKSTISFELPGLEVVTVAMLLINAVEAEAPEIVYDAV